MRTVGVIGAGTMGAGIAQVAATHGWTVMLMDVDESIAVAAVEGIRKRLDRLVEKGKLTSAQREAIQSRLHVVLAAGPRPPRVLPLGKGRGRPGLPSLADCELVIEAVVEDLDAKVKVFESLRPSIRDDCILATNTSSLSVAQMGNLLGDPAARTGPADGGAVSRTGLSARFVGMHFFNPVPLMPLVEVVSGPHTDPTTADKVAEVAGSWGKTVVRCKDTPGFIVNRVARGFYLESLRIVGEGRAGIAEVDGIIKRLGAFRMGPFELMDLVGIDVNYTVSCALFSQMGKPARLMPHPIQAELFQRRQFGRKTGRGFYSYEGSAPTPLNPPLETGEPPRPPLGKGGMEGGGVEFPASVQAAVQVFCAQATSETGSLTEQYVFARVLATVINEAALALDEGVASSDDIDTAMKTGTNYPKGPLEWAHETGFGVCRKLLDVLNAESGDDRFTPAKLLCR